MLNELIPPRFTQFNLSFTAREGANITLRITATDGALDPFTFAFGQPPPPGASLSRGGLLTWLVPLDASQFGTPPGGRPFNLDADPWGVHAFTIVATADRRDAVRFSFSQVACSRINHAC